MTVILAAGALAATMAPPVAAQPGLANAIDVQDPVGRRAAVAVLNGYLTPIAPSARIIGCDMLTASHLGALETVYAGVCQVESRARIIVCGGTGIGEFALGPWRERTMSPQTRAAVLKFAVANCPGG